MFGFGVETLGSLCDQWAQQIKGDNTPLLGFPLDNFDHAVLDQTKHEKSVHLRGANNDSLYFRRTTDFAKDPNLPGILELQHRCANDGSASITGSIGNHENLHRGFCINCHFPSLAEIQKLEISQPRSLSR